MAIAPSRLGRLIRERIWGADADLLRHLRIAGLIRRGVPDGEVIAVFEMAREEHRELPEDVQAFNSPEERTRVFLEPYLSSKGKKWAVPLDSLKPPWWKFWTQL